jgi:uncharacterized membrane protein (DUF4010 family)
MEQYLNMQLVHFALTAVFSFLIGLEIKTYRLQFHAQETGKTIGSARTYTFLGIIGYLFCIVDDSFAVYIAGLAGFTLFFALFYVQQLKANKSTILLYLVALIVYSFGPLVIRYPLWLASLLFVLTIFILNAKQRLHDLTQHINAEELETLGKMVLLSAVILPLLPHDKVNHFLPLSPFEIWLAVVIISAISYGGYLVQKYFFRQKGYLLAGIVGGIYSSTATTVVLARKAKALGAMPVLTASIIAASSMMYLRLVIVAAVFNRSVAASLLLPFVAFFIAGVVIVLLYARNSASAGSDVQLIDKNPLELGTAFLFGGLFIGMMVLTQSVTAHFGTDGLNILSFLVGFTDIDPFVLSILTGHYTIGDAQVVSAIMIAAGSNNILKAFYALWIGGVKGGLHASIWLTVLGVGTIGSAFVV